MSTGDPFYCFEHKTWMGACEHQHHLIGCPNRDLAVIVKRYLKAPDADTRRAARKAMARAVDLAR